MTSKNFAEACRRHSDGIMWFTMGWSKVFCSALHIVQIGVSVSGPVYSVCLLLWWRCNHTLNRSILNPSMTPIGTWEPEESENQISQPPCRPRDRIASSASSQELTLCSSSLEQGPLSLHRLTPSQYGVNLINNKYPATLSSRADVKNNKPNIPQGMFPAET